jgi:hypothetical protein
MKDYFASSGRRIEHPKRHIDAKRALPGENHCSLHHPEWNLLAKEISLDQLIRIKTDFEWVIRGDIGAYIFGLI